MTDHVSSRSISVMPRRLNLFLLSLLTIGLLAFGAEKIRRDAGPSVLVQVQSTSSAITIVPVAATSSLPGETSSTTVQTNATVVRVVDGDTLVARLDSENKEFTIRLLGVNTPETVDPRKPVECFGKEASAFAKKTLNAKRIRLDADPQADERDKYDRLLRNVTTAEGVDFNAELVRQGYAYAYLSFPLNPERKRELKSWQEEAKINERGLWAPEACGGG